MTPARKPALTYQELTSRHLIVCDLAVISPDRANAKEAIPPCKCPALWALASMLLNGVEYK